MYHWCRDFSVDCEQKLHGFVRQFRHLAKHVLDLEYMVEILISAFFSEQHQLFEFLHVEWSDPLNPGGPENSLGRGQPADDRKIHAADDQAGIYAAENMSGTASVAGCTADATTRVRLVGPDSTEKESTYPCFEHQTMSDILPPGITWRYYAPSAGSIWTAPNAIAHICKSTGPGGKCVGNDWTANVDLTPAHVLTDIGACKLRSLTWVIPSGLNSDHANSNDGGGPSWVASIVNAIGTNTTCDTEGYWKNTAIVITWDDWGGWYDHVPPTVLPSPFGGYQLGFRVPLIFVSAYTKAGYINNDRHDFGDILRFAESNFGLRPGALGFADSRSTNQLSGFYDLSQAPRSFTPTAALKSASFFIFDKRPATDPDNDGDEGDAPKP